MRRVGDSLLCLSSAAAFALRGLSHLYHYHPHEDAYILFRYAEHTAEGHGIVYNPMGPPAEGATDFLWMLMLSLGVRLGVDVALAALVCNAVGCALLTWAVARLLHADATGMRGNILVAAVALAAPLLPSSHSAVDGFSTQLYCGLCALGVSFALAPPARRAAMPALLLSLGLFRPDGVILAGGLLVAALMTGWRDAEHRRFMLYGSCVACVIGSIYFVWRWQYFGAWLPLPLQVKAHGPGAPWAGLSTNLQWLRSASGPLPLIAAIAILAPLVSAARRRAVVFALLPAALLFLALARPLQSQNVDWRFEAPIYLSLLVVMFWMGAAVMRERPVHQRIGVAGAILAALLPALIDGKRAFPPAYIDGLAPRMGVLFDEQHRMVVTEAGRLPYWTEAEVFDAVGLNTPEAARRPPDAAFLQRFDPDLVFLHTAGTFDLGRAIVLEGNPRRDDVLMLQTASLSRALRPAARRLVLVRSWDSQRTNHEIAAAILIDWLSSRDDMDVFAARYGGRFSHLWAVRRQQPYSEPAVAQIREIHATPYRSYAAIRGWGAPWTGGE